MKEDELRACPFCGEKAELKNMGMNRYHIKCCQCGAQIGETWSDTQTIEENIKDWNKRAPDINIKMLETLKVFMEPSYNCASFNKCYKDKWPCSVNKKDCRFINTANIIQKIEEA